MNTPALFWASDDKARHFIEDTPEAMAQALADGAMFTTWTRFETKPMRSPEEKRNLRENAVHRWGDFPVDLDREHQPEECLGELQQLAARLETEYGVAPEHLRFFYSGKKGFHLIIPAPLFGPECEAGHPLLPMIYKHLARRLLSGLTTVDSSLYNMGLGKLFRLPNVRRSNGRHKIPLTAAEICPVMGLSIAEITALSESPRELPAQPSPEGHSAALQALFLECREQAERDLENQHLPEPLTPEQREALKGSLPPCIAKVLGMEDYEGLDLNFNKIVYSLLIPYFKSAGFGIDAACDAATEFLVNFNASSTYTTPQERLDHFRVQWGASQYNWNCAVTKRLLRFDCQGCRIKKAELADVFAPSCGADKLESLRLGRFLDTPAPEIRYVIKDAIPQGVVVTLTGPGGSLKTTFAQNVMLAVGTTLPALNGIFDVSEHGPVLYVNGEDPEPILHKQFLRRFEHEKNMREGFEDSKWTEIERRFREDVYILSCAGAAAHLARPSREGILEPTKFFNQLLETAGAIESLKLIVMDTKSRLFPGDEKNNDQAAQIISLLERFCKDTDCSVLLVNHVTKASQNSRDNKRDAWKGPLDPTAGRGGGALQDNSRAGIAMVRVPEGVARSNGHSGEQPLVCVRVNKNSYGPSGHEVWMTRTREGGLCPFITKKSQDEPELLKKVIERVVEDVRSSQGQRLLRRAVWKDRAAVYKAEGLPVTQDTVKAGISEAIRLGFVVAETRRSEGNGKEAEHLVLVAAAQ